MKRVLSTLGIFTFAAVAGCAQPFSVDDGKLDSPMEVGGLTFLDQEWNDEHRDQFHNTPQGNLIIPYKWFLYLETANSTKLFRGDENIEKFRYLIGHQTDRNEENPPLPVGFTKENYDQDMWEIKGAKTWLGINCAACHTSQINFKGKIKDKDNITRKIDAKIRIDGGSTMVDLGGFLGGLNKA